MVSSIETHVNSRLQLDLEDTHPHEALSPDLGLAPPLFVGARTAAETTPRRRRGRGARPKMVDAAC